MAKINYKVTLVTQDKTEVYDWTSYYEILHFVFDLLVFRFNNKNWILKIEVIENHEETKENESKS